MIRVATNIPDSFHHKAEYVFRFFSDLWGIPVSISHHLVQGEKLDVIYSSNHEHQRQGIIYIPFNERLYDAECCCDSVQHDGLQLWTMAGAEPDAHDIVASTFRLLTFLDEQQIPQHARDHRGTFFSHALPVSRQRTAQFPLADHHARYLLQQLSKSRTDFTQPTIPKWPGHKKYAIAITHDTDAISLGAAKELITNISKFMLRRDRMFLEMFTSGLRYIRDPTNNPFFGFSRWREFEASRHIRSCFYLFAKVVPLRRDINNCKSSVVEPRIDWRILRRLAPDGW